MSLFRRLALRNDAAAASITWGYYTAAALRTWTLSKSERGEWSLRAGIDRADPFKLRQRPLLFIAPREGGYFCFPIRSISVGKDYLTAQLGKPEH